MCLGWWAEPGNDADVGEAKAKRRKEKSKKHIKIKCFDLVLIFGFDVLFLILFLMFSRPPPEKVYLVSILRGTFETKPVSYPSWRAIQ